MINNKKFILKLNQNLFLNFKKTILYNFYD